MEASKTPCDWLLPKHPHTIVALLDRSGRKWIAFNPIHKCMAWQQGLPFFVENPDIHWHNNWYACGDLGECRSCGSSLGRSGQPLMWGNELSPDGAKLLQCLGVELEDLTFTESGTVIQGNRS